MAASTTTKLNPQAPEFFFNNHRFHYRPINNPLPHQFFQPPNPNPSFYYSSAPSSITQYSNSYNPLPLEYSVPAVTQPPHPLHEASATAAPAMSPRGGGKSGGRCNGKRYCNPPINRREKLNNNEANKQSWRRKGDSSNSKTNPKRRPADRKIKSGYGGSKSIQPVLPVESDGQNTTVMIRNIPNKYTREMLMEMIDEHCKKENEEESKKRDEENTVSAFDFLYLPIDFESSANKGYGFVNFTDPKAVWKFKEAKHNKKWPSDFQSNKVCSIAFARVQGKLELARHFNRSVFRCHSEDYLPVCFTPARDGSGSVVHQTLIGTRVW